MANGYLDKAAKLLELLYGPPGAKEGQTHLAMKQGGASQPLPGGLGKMIRGYELPEEMEPVPEPAPAELPPTADYAKWADRLQKEPQPVQEVPGLTPERRRGVEGLIGGTAGTPTAEITGTLPEEPGTGGMSPDKRALLLRVLSGLTTAGRRMTSTPTLAEIRHGAKITPEFRPETKLAGAAEQIEQEERIKKAEAEAKTKAEEEGAKSPLVEAARKLATSMGLDPSKIKTEEQAKSMLMAFGQEEKIKLLQAQRGKVEQEVKMGEAAQEHAAVMATARESGDLSGLSDKAKAALEKTEDKLQNNPIYKKYVDLAATVTQLRNHLTEGGELAYKAAPVLLARAMGEVGNLSQTDLSFYRKNLGIKGEIVNWVEYFESMPQQERLDAMNKVIDSFEKSSVPVIKDVTGRFAESYTRKYKEAPKEAIMNHFNSFAIPAAIKEAGIPEVEKAISQAKRSGRKLKIIDQNDNEYTIPAALAEQHRDQIKEVIGLE